jgi:hypothetical protein
VIKIIKPTRTAKTSTHQTTRFLLTKRKPFNTQR